MTYTTPPEHSRWQLERLRQSYYADSAPTIHGSLHGMRPEELAEYIDYGGFDPPDNVVRFFSSILSSEIHTSWEPFPQSGHHLSTRPSGAPSLYVRSMSHPTRASRSDSR